MKKAHINAFKGRKEYSSKKYLAGNQRSGKKCCGLRGDLQSDWEQEKVSLWLGLDPYHLKYTEGTVKHPNNVMVWGYLGVCGVTKEFNNKNHYLQLLADYLEQCLVAF